MTMIIIGVIIASIALVLSIGLAVYLLKSKKPTTEPSPDPTPEPTPAPSSDDYDALKKRVDKMEEERAEDKRLDHIAKSEKRINNLVAKYHEARRSYDKAITEIDNAMAAKKKLAASGIEDLLLDAETARIRSDAGYGIKAVELANTDSQTYRTSLGDDESAIECAAQKTDVAENAKSDAKFANQAVSKKEKKLQDAAAKMSAELQAFENIDTLEKAKADAGEKMAEIKAKLVEDYKLTAEELKAYQII